MSRDLTTDLNEFDMKKKFAILLMILIIHGLGAQARVWTLENAYLRISFDDRTALLEVRDKRCDVVWSQSAADSAMGVSAVTADDDRLHATLDAGYPVRLEMTLEGSSVAVDLSADADTEMSELLYPAPFSTKDAGAYLLLTDGEGLMLPVSDRTYAFGSGISYFCGGGLSMSWMGMLSADRESGYMAIVDTPFDARLEPFRQPGDSLVSFRPVWMSTLGHFGYARRLVWHFFDKGGYVAQSKRYRDYIWAKREIQPLRERRKRFPALDKMLGAPHVYVWDTGRDVSVARRMKERGIDRALFLWDANHLPYPVVGYDDSLKRLGYATGGYELFTDLHKRDTVVNDLYPFDGPLRHKHCVYPGRYEALAARKADGSTYSNQFGTYACPAAMQPEIRSKMDRKMAEYHHEALFLDVYQANGLYECYNRRHPVSRERYARAILANYRLLEEDYGLYLGGEWGADFAVPHSVFVHGMMTLQWPWWGSEIDEKGTIYYYGDWKNNSRPSIQVGTRTAGPTYYKYCINEALRVPLYELVYHDAVVTSWRWEDANHHYPELWWKKDLYNMLYGSAPLWSMDLPRWESFENTFIRSYRQVCPWLRQIAYDEMTDHRFVTPDGRIQRSDFSSGRSIVVNFSDRDYDYLGRTIAARSYVIL